jgi:hypothetical protein
MSIVEMMLPRSQNEGDMERQLNNVIDRGLQLYLGYLAAGQIGLIPELGSPRQQEDSLNIEGGILRQLGLIPSAIMPRKLEAIGALSRSFM